MGLGFLILTILMFLSIALVIWRLRVKQKANGISKIFGREIWNLLIILILFASSFLFRFAWDEWLAWRWYQQDGNVLCTWEDGTISFCNPYPICTGLLITQYIFDLIPIGAIFAFHHYNFRNKNRDIIKDSVLSSSMTHFVSFATVNEQSTNEIITENQASLLL